MVQLEQAAFLNQLGKLFERNQEKGTVYLTVKRTNLKPRKSKKEYPDAEYKCLVRASDGTKMISTVLGPKDYAKFQESYATILRASTGGLKKRERVKPATKK